MTLRAIDHVQVAIPRGEEARALGFYCGLLGLTETPKPAVMAARGGAWLEAPGIKLHLGADDDFRPARKAHVAFQVDDVEALVERASAVGCEVKRDLMIDGYDQRAFIFDPFGNRLEFLRLAGQEEQQ